jgi:hypothetical protein
MPRLFSRAETACASGMPPLTLARLSDRDILKPDQSAQGSGTQRGYSRSSVYTVAIVAALMRGGLTPRAAALAASAFSRPQIGREASRLFAVGGSLLIAERGAARVLKATPSTILASVLQDGTGRSISHGTIVVDLNALLAEVDAKLGI